MKKINLMIAAGLMCAASVSAQTTIASVGFEPGDQKYTTAHAYTPGGTWGDWVNKQAADIWTEPYDGDVHSGEYSFKMENDQSYTGNTWDRGFKIGNLMLKNNTSYRVSFWVKAEPTFLAEDGTEHNTSIKSSLSIGREYCDMPITTASGLQYYYNWNNGVMTGEWQRFSFMTFFTNKEDQDKYSINYTGKEDPEGNIVWPQAEPFPNEYFLIINMFNPGEYLLDDIKVEEGVIFNAATYVDDVIKLDFGYPTNIADLAKEQGGTLSLGTGCVKVTIDGKEAPVAYVEGQSDGFLYIFLDGVSMEEGQNVLVSFEPGLGCPIVYNNDRRPSADVESDMAIVGFKDEVAYFDPTIDALPSIWGPAQMVSSIPENESFEIDGSTFSTVSITFDKELDLDNASAMYEKNGVQTYLPWEALSLSDDKKTVNIAVGKLADGEYMLTLSGVANSFGVACLDDQKITFAIGVDEDETVSEVVYASDFDNEMTGGVPEGWVTYNEAGFHIYGFNDEARTSQYNYNWGGQPGGGGTRLYEGFSGDFNKAMYWGTRGTNEGYAEYGSQVKDYIMEDGTIDPEMPEGIALKLEPRKYQISFLMAAWKGEPTFTFTLEDLSGNVYAKFTDILAAPNVNGATGNVSGSVKCITDFTVDKEGYYVLRFTAAEAQWMEYLLANVKLITMPSKAAYYRQLLAADVEKAKAVLETAEGAEYDGETKSALVAAINRAETEHFTSGSQITALMDEMDALCGKLTARVTNIDDFNIAIIEASAGYDELDGKYLETEIAKRAKAIIDKYGDTNPSTLSDEELAEVTPQIKTAAAQIVNVQAYVDIITWGAYKAAQTATTLGADGSAALNLVADDRAVIDGVNAASTIELYKKIAAGSDLADVMEKVYDNQHQNQDSEDGDPNYDENGYPLIITGIDFTGLVKNPHFYTYSTNASASLEDNTIVGWNCEQYVEYDEEGNITKQGSVHFNGTAATEAMPVANVQVNAYGAGAEYKFYQTIENAPVGTYDVYIKSRTAYKSWTNDDGEEVPEPFNAQDENGVWDKYIFAQVDDAEMQVAPFESGTDWGGYATVIRNVTVKEGQKLTIGAIEHYVSGKATNLGVATDFWDTNTTVCDARLYFVAPLAGYDYAKAAQDMETGIEAVAQNGSRAAKVAGIYSVSGARVTKLQKGINIVRMSDGRVQKVLVK